jgi:hypothetical protein
MSLASNSIDLLNPSTMPDEMEVKESHLFNGKLKIYQRKGLNWLANLFDQGRHTHIYTHTLLLRVVVHILVLSMSICMSIEMYIHTQASTASWQMKWV